MRKHMILYTLIFSFFLIGCSAESEENSKLITYQEYHKIKHGMSYEEVRDIIGGEGKLDGDEYSATVRYIWDGKTNNSFAAITFQKDNVIRKFEKGVASRK